MSSNYQQRRNSLNRSLQFEQQGQQSYPSDFMVNENEVNQNYNSGHHNRFARIIHNNYNSNAHKNSMSYDNHYATLDESVLNYTNNSKINSGNNGGTYITPIKNILLQKMNNLGNNLTTSSNNNNYYIYNNNMVSLSLEQPKRIKPKKNNFKSSLTQAEKVYSSGGSNNNCNNINNILVKPNQIPTHCTSKEKKSKLDIESLQNRILNEGVRGYTVKDSFNNIVVNYAPNINQIIPTTKSSAKLSQNNIKSGIQQNQIPSSTRQISNQQQYSNNAKDIVSNLNRSIQKTEADRATNLTMASASKNSDNLNTTMTNNRCSSVMSFHEEIINPQSGGYTNQILNTIDTSSNILENLMGNENESQKFKEKKSNNNGVQAKPLQVQQGNQIFLKQSEINYINSIKQKMSQGDSNQSVSARYQSQSQSTNQQQQQNQDHKSLYNVQRNNRYGDIVGSNGEQTSKSNNSIKSILTEKRKYKIDENKQIQINSINISYNQLNRGSNPSAPNSSSQGQKFILKENNPNITLDSSLAFEGQKINFDNYNIHSNHGNGSGNSLQQGKQSNNSLYNQQQQMINNRYNHHIQLQLGNANIPSTNNHTSKSINIVNRTSNMTTTTNQNNQKKRDFTYDSIQYDQLPSHQQQQQQYSFILNPNTSAQFNTISHNSGGLSSGKGSTTGAKRKKIQIHSKLLNSSINNITNNNSTAIGVESTSSSVAKQKTPENNDRSGLSSQLQKVYKVTSSQISQNQNLVFLLQKVKECFSRFKSRQDQITNGGIDKIQMEQIVNKYNFQYNSKSPNRISQSDRCTPHSNDLNNQNQNKQNLDKQQSSQNSKNCEDVKKEINEISKTLNSNNSQNINQFYKVQQKSASSIIKNEFKDNKSNQTQYKYHKIGINILHRLFKKKYSYQFFIQLIKDQNKSHFSC
ncbi:hypothetical protein TTHERM_00684520 (macronuclear) [Tetrahymena thermophila SB210]|uniref:Uncharacterized protein n=1 Tax=Tetrahymena thermophila (strain SB210) TaxID=312017 RepID=I7LXM0_TETTS|nr:hypothetical protein TTHERM_00684520 [Tetrahymena thermophila SB210]EAS04908.2 hypothetical protein TTHERM_00684520 [Tetrahymena thermophila SB210]|eukprot:XP_001025153.2 hypothetical protein TTHERM_00684520 [Tetrahymena thermophila SB210]